MLLLVLLPAGLHKEGVGRGLPPRLGRIFPHNFQSLKFVRVKKKINIYNVIKDLSNEHKPSTQQEQVFCNVTEGRGAGLNWFNPIEFLLGFLRTINSPPFYFPPKLLTSNSTQAVEEEKKTFFGKFF